MPTKLTDIALRNMKPDDRPLTDDIVTGLIATPTRTGAKWSVRYVSPVTAKRREAGIGVYPDIKLAEARERGKQMRRLIDAGKDPLIERESERVAATKTVAKPTFGEAAKSCHGEKKAGWKKTKNVAHWLANVEMYFKPILARRVDTLTPADFAEALRPVWLKYPRSSEDALSRAKIILQWCFAKGYIDHVTVMASQFVRPLLPGRKVEVASHNPSMPWKKAPAFVAKHLAGIKPTEPIRACVFVIIHAACRPSEARGMRWSELDLDHAIWTIPGGRMKMKKMHKVPLAPDVVDLLRAMSEAPLHPEYVFPNTQGRNFISDVRLHEFMRAANAPSDVEGRGAVPHGWRATFKDWAIDHGYDERVADRQLAHGPRGETGQAYERTTQLPKRTRLIHLWADYLQGRAVAENVIPLTAAL
jgi:integrase